MANKNNPAVVRDFRLLYPDSFQKVNLTMQNAPDPLLLAASNKTSFRITPCALQNA
jgi:hypothetical protein